MMALKVHDIADESTGNGTGNLLAARNSHLGWRPVWKKTLHLAIGIEIQMWDTCFVGKKTHINQSKTNHSIHSERDKNAWVKEQDSSEQSH